MTKPSGGLSAVACMAETLIAADRPYIVTGNGLINV